MPAPLAWRVAAVAALVVIGIATLLPAGGPPNKFSACVFCGDDRLADVIRNVILFIPLGFSLAHVTRRRGRALIFAALVTASIELTQRIIPGRDPSLGDVITNTLGAAIGIGLAVHQSKWTRRRGLLALGAASFAAATFLITGWLLQPVYPRGAYVAQWTPRFPAMAWYHGRVLDAEIDGISLTDGRLAQSDTVVDLLARGSRLQIRALAGPPVSRLAPLFSISDVKRHTLLLVGPGTRGVVLRRRLRAWQARVDSPDLLLTGLSLGRPGDTVSVSLWRQGASSCIAVNATQRCGLGFTLGSGWALVWYPGGMPASVASALTPFWVVLLLAPVGFWMTRDVWSGAGVVLVAVALGVGPGLTGLRPTPGIQWIAAVVGLAVGACLQWLISRPRWS